MCARIGRPTGGPKDVTPPKVTSATPPNYTTNFNKDKIEIYFNEFVKVQNAKQKVIISPPLKEDPNIILKGKSIVIELKDTLAKNTSYTISFNKAIKDNNEGNPLGDFRYVFSTGSYIDSLNLRGKIVKAFNHQVPEERTLAVLYKNLSDTAFYTLPPNYLALADKEGSFNLTHLSPGKYRLYALSEDGGNLFYDPWNERIAFHDSIIHIDESFYEPPIDSSFIDSLKSDSLIHDSINQINKTTQNQTILKNDSILAEIYPDIPFFDLYLFKEDKPLFEQYIKKHERPEARKLDIYFTNPVDSSLTFNLLPDSASFSSMYILEKNGNLDSLTLWLLDSNIYQKRTINLAVEYSVKDSGGSTIQHDTLRFIKQSAQKNKRNKNRLSQPQEKTNFIELVNIQNKGPAELNQSILFQSAYPIANTDSSYIRVQKEVDTNYIKVPFELKPYIVKGLDTFPSLRKKKLIIDWEENQQYRITLLPGAITNYYKETNDTLTWTFKTRKENYYGSIRLEVDGTSHPLVGQLWDEKENNKLYQAYADNKGIITFNYLKPQEYLIKIILDRNNNQQWDTGELKEKKQPEEVKYYPEVIDVKSNWEKQLPWKIK